MPPPTHIVTMPYRACRRCISYRIDRRQLGARAAQRMAERDGAAVDVQPFRIDRQLLQAREHLRRERLVELDEVHLLDRQSGQLQHLLNRRDRSDAESFRLDAGRRKCRRSAPAARGRVVCARRGRDDDGGRAVARLRRIAGGDRALGVKRRPELAERLRRGVAARTLVGVSAMSRRGDGTAVPFPGVHDG